MTTGIQAVHLSGPALAVIRRESTPGSDDLETGGILLGQIDGPVAGVLHAGDPGPGARRTRTSFRRDLAHAQRLADEAFASDGSQWIGDWHTHIDAAPIPSRLDLRTYRRLLDDPELGFTSFVSVIVSIRNGTLTTAAWACGPDGANAVPFLTAPVTTTTGPTP